MKKMVGFDSRAYIFTQKIVGFLEEKDYESFAEEIRIFIIRELANTEYRLYNLGFKPEELHPKSSIQPIVISKRIQDKTGGISDCS